MARSFPVARPGDISSIGGELLDVKNEALRRLRLPEAVPEFENFITSAFGKRKQKHQEAITLNERQKVIDFMENLHTQRDPLGLMQRYGGQAMPSYADPSQWMNLNQDFQPDIGLMLNDFSGRAGMQGFSGLNMGGMF